MKDYRIKLIEKIKRTDFVKSFRFSLNERLDFLPGQFLRIIFDGENINNFELNKFLSFSCAPGMNYIEVTKKISDSLFSKRLVSLQPGDEVLIKAPMGKSVFSGEQKSIAFLIGGIGITPAISIIENIVKKELDTDVALLYSNWTEKDIAFREELDEWNKLKNIQVFYKINEGVSKENISLGFIEEKYVKSVIPDYKSRIIYIYGPPVMVDIMDRLCNKIGCVKDKIIREMFIGY